MKSLFASLWVGIAVWIWTDRPTTVWADDKDKAIAKEIDELSVRLKKRQQELTKKLDDAKTPEEEKKVIAELRAFQKEADMAFLNLIKKYPASPAVVQITGEMLENTPEEAEFLLGVLEKHHLADPKVGDIALRLHDVLSERQDIAEKFLRTLMDKSPQPEGKAKASVGLALLMKVLSERSATQEDRDKKLKEAETLLDAAATKHGKAIVSVDAGEMELEKFIKPYLFEIRFLSVGRKAPELAGNDMEGKPMKLSDFAGKVILLDFWASWCGPCMAMVPHNKKLVKNYAGKPFVLLGVNADEDLDEYKKAVNAEGISWRSFRHKQDDKKNLLAEWNIQAFPTLYLIDHQGVIRARWIGNPGDAVIEQEIEKLVKVAEAK